MFCVWPGEAMGRGRSGWFSKSMRCSLSFQVEPLTASSRRKRQGVTRSTLPGVTSTEPE